MFNFNELKSVHLEITSRCQAKCPMCSRNIHGGIPNTQGFLVDWTLDEFKKICNEELITQIKKFVFTGGFGDPMVNNDFINMCQYTVDINPEIDILAHTNGGLRKEEWWQELAKSMPKKHAVTFALDGLEDTHHLYRIGTTYEKVIRNAKAFINAGGRADWQFIRFKHNEHQVEEAIKRAKDLGFVSFTLRETTRFTGNEKFEVYDNTGKITHYLEIPTDNIMKNIDDEINKDFLGFIKRSPVNCIAKQHKEIFIDAWKNLYPCTFLGVLPSLNTFKDPGVKMNGIFNFIEVMNYKNNTLEIPVRDILNSNEWLSIDWENVYWNNDTKLPICALTCGLIETKFKEETNRKVINTIKIRD